jgi:chloride channel protein, CIC family
LVDWLGYCVTSFPSSLQSLHRRALQWLQTTATKWLASATYAQKWLILGTLIGVVSGLGAVVFFEALKVATHLLLTNLGGYHPGGPKAESNMRPSTHFPRPWAIPLVAGGGALLGAILVYRFAPEAEGHGTDAAIEAVHHNPRGIRIRTVVVKIVASALTIGSGGSAGREGPTGQISAGFGSLISRVFDLSPSDSRIAVASGIGSGIGSIFGAPLAGAVLATEILYRDDFEVEALVPAFIASFVGYAVWGTFEGFGPLFGFVGNYTMTSAAPLLWFALIGALSGGVGLLYAKGFYGVAALFERLPVPRWVRPAIGGLLVGCIGLIIPEVLGTGYGWIQESLGARLLGIPLWIVLVVPFARILATGLSVGSGGSGGIFGPGMVIGAFLGAGVWRLLEPFAPGVGHSPVPFVIVGMMACFGSISRAPLAIMLMVAEMTGSLALIVPAMVAVGIATLIVRRNDDTIYRSQLRTRADAPAHRLVSGLPLLASIPVSDAMSVPRCVLHDGETVNQAIANLEDANVTAAPLVDDDGRFLSQVSLEQLRALPTHVVIATTPLVESTWAPVREGQHLDIVLESLATWGAHWLAVVDDERRVIGTVGVTEVVRAYRAAARERLAAVTMSGDDSGLSDVRVANSSDLAGLTMRSAPLPRRVFILGLERDGSLSVPTGDSTIEVGDRLTALGDPEGLEELRALAEGLHRA